MTRATLCLAIFSTLWLTVAHAMTGGSPWPMIAAALLAVIAPTLLHPQNVPFYARRS